MLKRGDKVDIIDCSYTYLVGEKLENHASLTKTKMQDWKIVALDVSLPSPNDTPERYLNNTIIKKNCAIIFINSKSLTLKKMKKWLGPLPYCDFKNPSRPGCSPMTFFVDGKTSLGTWALMCPSHFKIYGCGLGCGKGQKYDGETLEKINEKLNKK